jgi:cytochrome b561
VSVFNTPQTFGTPARLLHWLTLLLLLGSFGLGLTMVELPVSPQKLKFYSWHKWIGVTVFFLVVLRLGWRSLNVQPGYPARMPPWERRAARLMHWFIYLLLLAIPLSGWVMSSALGFSTVYLGIWQLPDLVAKNKPLGEALKTVHYILNKTLLVAVGLHAVAALKHHFLDRDQVLRSMLPFVRVRWRTP